MGRLPEWITNKKRVLVDSFIELKGSKAPLKFNKHGSAKRYILRVHPDGYIQVTLPPRGNRKDALVFVEKNKIWLEKQWEAREQKLQERQKADRERPSIHYRGKLEPVSVISADGKTHVSFADRCLPIDLRRMNLKQWLEHWLRYQASAELPDRVDFFARQHGFQFNHITIRDQRTRWGSCSSNRTISLNWRLIQIPPEHCDYIILHELNHLEHMNHSIHFWKSLEALCPLFRKSEAWLKVNGKYLRD